MIGPNQSFGSLFVVRWLSRSRSRRYRSPIARFVRANSRTGASPIGQAVEFFFFVCRASNSSAIGFAHFKSSDCRKRFGANNRAADRSEDEQTAKLNCL